MASAPSRIGQPLELDHERRSARLRQRSQRGGEPLRLEHSVGVDPPTPSEVNTMARRRSSD